MWYHISHDLNIASDLQTNDMHNKVYRNHETGWNKSKTSLARGFRGRLILELCSRKLERKIYGMKCYWSGIAWRCHSESEQTNVMSPVNVTQSHCNERIQWNRLFESKAVSTIEWTSKIMDIHKILHEQDRLTLHKGHHDRYLIPFSEEKVINDPCESDFWSRSQ
jgi:hypothetical protein